MEVLERVLDNAVDDLKTRERKILSDELAAIRTISEALAPLNQGSRRRVLVYSCDRFLPDK